MNGWLWFVVGFYVTGWLAAVWTIGRPRDPQTPGDAIATVVISCLMLLVILHGAGVDL